jgi:6-phosphogluconolactonase (cycloisomerase 2 family)
MSMSQQMATGHLYIQTNEARNALIHYHRSANGALTEVERVATDGGGSGTFKPISGQESWRFLFTTNGGDNSVSSFRVGDDGRLTQLDVKPTGNPVEGRSGTAQSLAYAPSKGMLFVLHSFGPDHLRLMSVDAEGKLAARPERYTANTKDKTDRVPTMGPEPPDGNPLPPGNVRARWGAMSVAYRPDTLATFHQRLPAP